MKSIIFTITIISLTGFVSLAKAESIFYGGQSLSPLVDKNNIVLSLSGGAKIKINEQNNYVLTDHLLSTRAIVGNDTEIDYSPFGDSEADTGSYTGMTFEIETATYDYHARNYDPSVARFTSLDSRREDASPYVYVGNNPIAFVDPSGGGRMPFILVSGLERGSHPIEYASAVELFNVATKGVNFGDHNIMRTFSTDALFSYTLNPDGSKKISKTLVIVKNRLLFSEDEENFSNKLFWIVTDKKPDKMGGIGYASEFLSRVRGETKKYGFASDAVIIDFSQDGTAHKQIKEQLNLLNGKDPLIMRAKVDKIGTVSIEGVLPVKMEKKYFAENIDQIKEVVRMTEVARRTKVAEETKGIQEVLTELVASIPTSMSQTGQSSGSGGMGGSLVQAPVPPTTQPEVSSVQPHGYGVGPMRHQGHSIRYGLEPYRVQDRLLYQSGRSGLPSWSSVADHPNVHLSRY